MMMKLPKGFEKTIIELEFQVEKETPTQELVSMLLSLYSVIIILITQIYYQVGVEHYDSVGDS